MTKATIGFAMCGSFCTFSKAFEQMRALVSEGIDVIPIMSENARSTDTRFGTAAEMVKTAEEITGKKVLSTSVETEPIGPKDMCDLLIIAPCTGRALHGQHSRQAFSRSDRHRRHNGGKVAP